MPELMPFGKFKEKSVEQVLLQDYKYFCWLKEKVQKPSLRQRFEFVDFVANNFISQKPCANCKSRPARLISIYCNWHMDYRGSDTGFVYCSQDCFDSDPKVTPESSKASLERLAFRTAFSSTKFDTKDLVEVIGECMGMRSGRRTKEYLDEFFTSFRYEPSVFIDGIPDLSKTTGRNLLWKPYR